MKYEIVTFQGNKAIGIAKEIDFQKGPEECPKFWEEFFMQCIKPVLDGNTPNPVQKAVMSNNVGQYAICDCDLIPRNCCKCSETNFNNCGHTFRYIISGIYRGGEIPEGMTLVDFPDGKWIKFHFEGGMGAFQQQYQLAFKEWIPAHKDIVVEPDMIVEWYDGNDINSPDFKCGIMLHISQPSD